MNYHFINRIIEIGIKEACNKVFWRITRAYHRYIFFLHIKNKSNLDIKYSGAKRISFPNDHFLHNQIEPSNPDLMKEAYKILDGIYTVHDHGEVTWDIGTQPWNEWHPDTVRSFHRHDFLISLVRAYKESRDEKFLATIKRLIHSLPDAYSFDSVVKYDKSIDIAIRILNWTAICSLVDLDFNLNDKKLLRYWYQQVEWMKANMSPGGNHRLLEALSLFASGIYFPELSISKHWKEKSFRIIINEIERQVHHDGVHAEQSMFYHQICTTHFFKFFILCRKSKTALPSRFEPRLQAMIDYIISAEKPDGTHPMIGDGDMLVSCDREHWEAREMISCYKNSYYGPLDRELIDDNGWFPIYTKPTERKNKDYSKTSVFQKGGHIFFKDDIGQYLFFNCGHFGYTPFPHHGHSDALSVEICLNHETITMDAGGYAYRDDPIRHFVRSTAAHNTVMVDGRDQSETSGIFKVGKTAATKIVKWQINEHFDMALGTHEGYLPVIHYRKIWLLKNGWKTFIVRDDIRGPGEHQIDVRYHLSPDIVHKQIANNKVLFYKDATYVGSMECYCPLGPISIVTNSNSDKNFPVSIISRKTGHYISSQLLSMQPDWHLPVSVITIFSGHNDYKYRIDFNLNKLIIDGYNHQFSLDIAMEESL